MVGQELWVGFYPQPETGCKTELPCLTSDGISGVTQGPCSLSSPQQDELWTLIKEKQTGEKGNGRYGVYVQFEVGEKSHPNLLPKYSVFLLCSLGASAERDRNDPPVGIS